MSRTFRNKAEHCSRHPRKGFTVSKSYFEQPYYSYSDGCHVTDPLTKQQHRRELTGNFTDQVYRFRHHNRITSETCRYEQKTHRSHARLEIQHFLRGERDDVILNPVQFSPKWLW